MFIFYIVNYMSIVGTTYNYTITSGNNITINSFISGYTPSATYDFTEQIPGSSPPEYYTTTAIAGSAFNGIITATSQSSVGLATLNIPPTVTTIGSFAFQLCSGVTGTIDLSNVSTLPAYTFRNSTFTNVILSTSLTDITYSLFDTCSNLHSVNIYATTFEGYGFAYCNHIVPYFYATDPITIPSGIYVFTNTPTAYCYQVNEQILIDSGYFSQVIVLEILVTQKALSY